MVEKLSPLGKAFRPGSHGNFSDGVGVTLSELALGSIIEIACWPGREKDLIAAIRKATGLSVPDGAGGGTLKGGRAAFGIGPGKFLLRDEAQGLATILRQAIPVDTGTVTDLSHGRTASRVAGPQAEWVLSKLYAIDFALPAFPLHSGKATVHHDILTQIQRVGDDAFDLFVFRSFARSFWITLGHAAEETGYVVK